MRNFLKTVVAVLFLPTLFFAAAQTARLLYAGLGNFKTFLCFLLGIGVYAGIHFGFYSFSRMYVLGHELTHAIAALLCGCRIRDIHVGKDSGYVKLTQCNSFVALSPYFIPIYTVLLGLVYCGLELWRDMAPYRLIFVFGVGFFTAFHFIQTFKTLFEAQQPDLKLAGGKVFSAISITLVNIIILALLCKILFPEQVSLLQSVRNVWGGTYNTWRILVNYIIELTFNAR